MDIRSKLSVLHIITRLDTGGSATTTGVMVCRLKALGVDVELAYGLSRDVDPQLLNMIREAGIRTYVIPCLIREPSPWNDIRACRQLRAVIRSGAYDLIHTHTSKAGIIGRWVAARAGIPAIHSPHGHVFYGYFQPWVSRVFVFMEQWAARRTARILSLTDRETQESLAHHIGRPDQYVTVHSGVPLARYATIPPAEGVAFRQQWQIAPEACVWLAMGRLVPIKGFDVLLRAMAAPVLQDVNGVLVLVGEGEERPALEEWVRELGLSGRVRMVGAMKDIRPCLSAATGFVLTSRNEGMGRVLIEAMAAGLPVIGTRVGGVPTLIRPGWNGWLVDPDDPEGVAHAMKALAANRTQGRVMGAQGQSFVNLEFDETTMVERVAHVYREVLAA